MHALTLVAPAAAVEAICELLDDAVPALAVGVEDADAGSAAEQPVFDEPGTGPTGTWRRALISALFDSEDEATAAAALLAASARTAGASIVGLAPVDDRDWVRLTQAQFGPQEIADGFWIVPTWADVPPRAEHVIRLDPGQAFGTGTHPTTRMCLRWIVERARRGRRWPRVLDYGAGSGVLAIAAGLLGARDIDAVDIDRAAVVTGRDNALANRVALRSGLPDLAQGRYALVLANILATPLKLLAPVLCAFVDEGGELVLSGILERQAGELRAAYAPWLALDVVASDDGWVLMTGSRATRMA
ncbi:MAG TPA: 50S ribosomal protein L11 methyltransferase [Caldimonas sp.]|jgi:ribosomal protein L11 methyltransferase|nr:50S ribosomal protein L11 methyltransferase [Caldimonas sp.]HEX2540877.1 50S ribosomal protein L11 methyltransferase [Caldimonas sp.]